MLASASSYVAILAGVAAPPPGASRCEQNEHLDRLCFACPANVLGPARETLISAFIKAALPHCYRISDLEDAADFLNVTSCSPPLTDRELRAIVGRAYVEQRAGLAPIPEPPKPAAIEHRPPGERPLIRCSPDRNPDAGDEIEAALLSDDKGDPIFRHAGTYASVRRTGRDGAAEIRHFDMASLRERIMRTVAIAVPSGAQFKPGKVPDDIVAGLLSRGGGNAPELRGICRNPIVLADGRVIDQPGYDWRTQLFFDFEPGAFPPVPTYAGKVDA